MIVSFHQKRFDWLVGKLPVLLDVYKKTFDWFGGKPLVLLDVYNKRFDWFAGKPLVLLDVYKKRFGWPPKEYVNLNKDTDISRGHVFVTGVSSNHYK